MDISDELSKTFITFSRHQLMGEMWPRLCSCLDELSDDQIWWRPNESSNSVGNLLLHLNGNLRQWILGGIGGAEQVRDRDAEFDERRRIPTPDLRNCLKSTLTEVDAVLSQVKPDELLRKHDIQVYLGVTALEAVYHVVEHFAMHYGQILYVSKLIRDQDLGFYAELRRGRSS